MTQRYSIFPNISAARTSCAAAGNAGVKMSPPLNSLKSTRYTRFVRCSDGTLQSQKDCGVPFCMPLYILQNLDGGKTGLCNRNKLKSGTETDLCNDYEPLTRHETGFCNRYKLSTEPKSDIVIITKPRRGQN